MTMNIRPLTQSDFPACDAILSSAFGTLETRVPELQRYLAFQPDGWFVADVDGQPAGMVGAVDYGPFAYLGMMAVFQHQQGRGLGRALMEHCLAWLDTRGCPMTLLDASPAGALLYPKLGFVDDDRSDVWVQPTVASLKPERGGDIRVESLRPEDIPAVAAFDAPIFGAHRPAVIEAYRSEFPDRALVARDENGMIAGYLIVQWRRIGPWAACTSQAAEALLAAALSLPFEFGSPMTICTASNTAAAEILGRAGFRPERPHRHMRRGGAANPINHARIFGFASFAIG